MVFKWLKQKIQSVNPRKILGNLTKKSWWSKKRRESKVTPQETKLSNEEVKENNDIEGNSSGKPKKAKKKKPAKMNREDVKAVIVAFDKLDGENWKIKDGWRSILPVKQWFGVVVVDTRITELCINSNLLKVFVSLPLFFGFYIVSSLFVLIFV